MVSITYFVSNEQKNNRLLKFIDRDNMGYIYLEAMCSVLSYTTKSDFFRKFEPQVFETTLKFVQKKSKVRVVTLLKNFKRKID